MSQTRSAQLMHENSETSKKSVIVPVPWVVRQPAESRLRPFFYGGAHHIVEFERGGKGLADANGLVLERCL